MVMTDSEPELRLQLNEAGKQLSNPPASVGELLHILDQTEKLLSKVDQSPNPIMVEALRPSMKALVEGNLIKHSDVDVKVSVAACLSEITRITAPDAPYDDDIMKDAFQLIVWSLENLSDNSSRSYDKKSSIIETLFKVRSCVIMLDLECDDLIVKMFEHFLKSIRDHHIGSIFSWMMHIMVLVLEESEDISIDMLKPLLACIKNNTEGVLPVARKLGEIVLQKSAAKLRPYLIETLKIMGDSLDKYSPVLASICEGTIDVVEHNDENASVQPQADESKLTTASSDNAAQVVIRKAEGRLPGEAAANPKSLKIVMSNGIRITGNEEGSADKESSKKVEEPIKNPDSNLTSKVDANAAVIEKPAKVESTSVRTSKRRGKKSDTTLKSPKPSETESSIGATIPSEIEKNTDISVAAPKAIESDVANAPSESDVKKDGLPPPVKVSLPYKRRKPAVRPKKKDATSTDVVSMELVLAKPPEVMSDSDMKSPKRGRKKSTIAKEDKLPATVATLEDGKATSGPDAELLETSSKKVDPVDSGSKRVRRPAKKVVAEDSVVKKSKSSGKKVDGGDSEAKKPKEDGKNMDAADSEGKPSRRPSLMKKDGCDSDAKPPKQSANNGKKRKVITKSSGHTANKEEGSDSDAKPLKLSAKKGNTSGSASAKSSSKNKDGKKRGRGKLVEEKDQEKSLSEDDGMDVTLQSALKTATVEANLGEALATTSKRKRSSGKKVAETIKYDDSLVGLKVKVWWPEDKIFYEGVIESFDSKTNEHKVLYEDTEVEILDLEKEKWEIVKDISAQKEKKAAEVQTNDVPETPKKKRSRIDSGPSASEEKIKDSAKRAGGASLSVKSKARGRPPKSAGSSKGVGKVNSKSKDSNSKDTSIKSQKSGGKSVEAADSKEAGMTEEHDEETPGIIPKNKQGTRKMVNKSKVKTPESGNKVDGDVKGSEQGDAAETPETAKGKSAEMTKAGSKSTRKKRKKRF